MTKAPRDAHSEVLDANRRWNPEWYTWLQETYTALQQAEDSISSYGVFGPVGTGHSTGFVPDPGTDDSLDKVLFNDATWQRSTRLRQAGSFDALGYGYDGQIKYAEDYGVVADYLDNGSVNSSYTDNATALQDLFDGLNAYDTVVLPAGFVASDSPLVLPEVLGISIIGRGSHANIVKTWTGGDTDWASDNIFFTLPAIDFLMRDVWFWNANGATGGLTLGKIAASGAGQAEQWRLQNIVFTRFGTGGSYVDFIIDAINGASSYGSRECRIDNMVCHGNYTGAGCYLGGIGGAISVTGLDLVEENTLDYYSLYIDGSSGNPSNDVMISATTTDSLYINYSNIVNIRAGALGTVEFTANAVDCIITAAFQTGSITNNGTNCVIQLPY